MRNVLAAAWSADGLLAFVTRAAWRGPKHQVHVVDAAHGFAPLARMDLPGAPDGEHVLVAFSGAHVVAHALGSAHREGGRRASHRRLGLLPLR